MSAVAELPLVWRPNRGPQTRFLASRVYEVLFGGAAGGGKSEALLVDALRQVHRPKYRALLLRRSFPELRELITRSRDLYPVAFPGARFNKQEKAWQFPNGAVIEFGYLAQDDDVYRYQGQEYSYVGWDEVTHFSEFAYTYLLSRVRTTDPDLQPRVRATANPGGRGHAWVKARFVDPAPAGVVFQDPATGTSRVFIASTLSDNPHLAVTDYGRRLEALPEADRRALLEGDWNAYEGSVFRLDAGVHVLTREQCQALWGGDAPPSEWPRFRVMDWGYARPFAILWIAVDSQGCAHVYREWYGVQLDARGSVQANVGLRLEPEEVARRVAEIERHAGEKEVTGWTGPDLFDVGRRDHGGGRPIAESFTRHGVFHTEWPAGPGSRRSKKIAVHERLAYKRNADGQLVQPPGLVIAGEACVHLCRTLPALEYDPHNAEDVDTTGEDHAYDALAAFCLKRPWGPRPKQARPDAYDRRLSSDASWEWA